MAGKLDLNLMLVLEAIYNEGNITRAANALFLGQSAVSHALARLRKIYRDPLFIRRGHTMVPTPLTERIIGRVKNGLREIRQSINEADSFNPADEARLFRIGLRDAGETAILPQLMPYLARQAPGIHLSCLRTLPAEIGPKLAAGKLDLALDVLHPVSDDIANLRLFMEPLVVVARTGHPAVDGGLSMEDYLHYPHVLVTLDEQGPVWIDHELSRHGLRRQVVLRCQHYFSAGEVIMNSDFLTTIPRSISAILARDLHVQALPLPFEAPSLDVRLYWHQRSSDDPANLWLRQQILATFASLDFVEVETGGIAWDVAR